MGALKIGSISTELKFKGDIHEIKEVIQKLQSEERERDEDWREIAKEFLTHAFGAYKNLDDTKAIFTQLDLSDMLDDFIDYTEGATWKELIEKNKKRRMARAAQNPRGPYA